MVFKNLIMKKILLILLMCLNYTSYSQELVRVIDTVLILDITSSTNVESEVYGSVISPPNGKVWKIQSLLLDPGNNLDMDLCGNGITTFSNSEVTSFLEIDDGINKSIICKSFPSAVGAYNLNSGQFSIFRDIQQCTENIIWINSTSTIKIGVVVTDTRDRTSFDVCVIKLLTKAHVSILEFEN